VFAKLAAPIPRDHGSGASGEIEFYGWQSKVGEAPPRFHQATKTPGRSTITCSGKAADGYAVSALAVQHPRDKFDRKIGKWLSLGRLVKRLLPDSLVEEKKFLASVKAERSRIFRLIWTSLESKDGKLVDPTASSGKFYAVDIEAPGFLNWPTLRPYFTQQQMVRKSLDNQPSKT